jgi:hypothetical protein
VTLSLLPFLPKTKETTIILLDAALELTEQKVEHFENMVSEWTTNVKTAEEHMAENPTWSRRDCVLRTLGVTMFDRNTIKAFRKNMSWSASGLLKNAPPNVKITFLAAGQENIPRDTERLNVKVLTGIGHWIQYECPDAIMDVIPLPRAKL